jgi:hypothetical protein
MSLACSWQHFISSSSVASWLPSLPCLRLCLSHNRFPPKNCWVTKNSCSRSQQHHNVICERLSKVYIKQAILLIGKGQLIKKLLKFFFCNSLNKFDELIQKLQLLKNRFIWWNYLRNRNSTRIALVDQKWMTG